LTSLVFPAAAAEEEEEGLEADGRLARSPLTALGPVEEEAMGFFAPTVLFPLLGLLDATCLDGPAALCRLLRDAAVAPEPSAACSELRRVLVPDRATPATGVDRFTVSAPAARPPARVEPAGDVNNTARLEALPAAAALLTLVLFALGVPPALLEGVSRAAADERREEIEEVDAEGVAEGVAGPLSEDCRRCGEEARSRGAASAGCCCLLECAKPRMGSVEAWRVFEGTAWSTK
jgi:hypothetical protein